MKTSVALRLSLVLAALQLFVGHASTAPLCETSSGDTMEEVNPTATARPTVSTAPTPTPTAALPSEDNLRSVCVCVYLCRHSNFSHQDV